MNAYDDFHKALKRYLEQNAVKYLVRFDRTEETEIREFLTIPNEIFIQMGAGWFDQVTEAVKYNQYIFRDEYIKFDELNVYANNYDDILGFSIVGITHSIISELNAMHTFCGIPFQCVKARNEKIYDFY